MLSGPLRSPSNMEPVLTIQCGLVHAYLTMVRWEGIQPSTFPPLQPMETPRLKAPHADFVRIRRMALPISNDGKNMVRKEKTTWL
jgi:hypothetical protein